MDEPAPAVAPFAHCSYCGHRFSEGAGWPRRCAACAHVSYRNPLPVAVLAVPVEDLGILMVRRVDPPAGLALPSGYIEHGERWQDAAARELAEETGVSVDPDTIRELRVRSGTDGTLLIFATAPPVTRADLTAFVPSAEVSEARGGQRAARRPGVSVGRRGGRGSMAVVTFERPPCSASACPSRSSEGVRRISGSRRGPPPQ